MKCKQGLSFQKVLRILKKYFFCIKSQRKFIFNMQKWRRKLYNFGLSYKHYYHIVQFKIYFNDQNSHDTQILKKSRTKRIFFLKKLIFVILVIFIVSPKSVRVFSQICLSDFVEIPFQVSSRISTQISTQISFRISTQISIEIATRLVALAVLVLEARPSLHLLRRSAAPLAADHFGVAARAPLLFFWERSQRVERSRSLNSNRLSARRTAASAASVSALRKIVL